MPATADPEEQALWTIRITSEEKPGIPGSIAA